VAGDDGLAEREEEGRDTDAAAWAVADTIRLQLTVRELLL
jgi:hypothetical protein